MTLFQLDTALTEDQIEETLKEKLDDLQGNILKGHGRNHSAHVFLEFRNGQLPLARAWVQGLHSRLTTASGQLAAAKDFKMTRKDAGHFQVFYLSAKGYEFFGRAISSFEPEFQEGMKAAQVRLQDPDLGSWEPAFFPDYHAMLLIADERQANVAFLARELEIEVAPFATVHIELGDQQRNATGDGIEHFGYVDGRSQPIMIQAELTQESDGTTLWDPAAGPSLVTVEDPFGAVGASGSYFVFRKLEQNVRGFKVQELQLAASLGLIGKQAELAGAYVVGRFEDGTPVTLSEKALIEGSSEPKLGSVPNNFDYRADLEGSKCPFQSHIRKSNPRGAGPGGLQEDKSRIMARRGTTYGKRSDDFTTLSDLPEGEVGLLFMSYQRSIPSQFEFIQSAWVNNENFPNGGTGIDPVIGQHGVPAPQAQNWPKNWGNPQDGTVAFDFRDFVRLRGGEYFFAPSLSSLKGL